MNSLCKISNIFKASLFIVSIIFLSTNIVKSQEKKSSENDFSNAENAEENFYAYAAFLDSYSSSVRRWTYFILGLYQLLNYHPTIRYQQIY